MVESLSKAADITGVLRRCCQEAFAGLGNPACLSGILARAGVEPGTRIGPYEVVESIGAGGMGEVYRARDLKLGRDVAIKVLPALLANDRNRLARFEREAQILASLNHAHIAQIYGVEETGGYPAIVMELVDGETLADRMTRGPVPLADALPIARQIAEALEAAHDQGIIHRDLKPANIKVRSDGTVKVLDFGLAKVIDPIAASAAGNSLALSAGATREGLILGTAPYMSPEQASGKPVDRRTDLWAFGAVFMEMLTGRQPFWRDTVPQVIAAVLTAEPDWSTLPPATPGGIQRLLRRCLQKDSRKRIDSAAVAALEIDDARCDVAEAHTDQFPPEGGREPRSRSRDLDHYPELIDTTSRIHKPDAADVTKYDRNLRRIIEAAT